MYIEEYIKWIGRLGQQSNIGVVVVNDTMEAEGLINSSKSNRTSFKILKGSKDDSNSARNIDSRHSIFDTVSKLKDHEGLFESQSPWYFKGKKVSSETYKYSSEKVILNYSPYGGELKIPKCIHERDKWIELRKEHNGVILYITLDELLNNYPLIGNNNEGIRVLLTNKAFNRLIELWDDKYLTNFQETSNGVRLFPTPYVITKRSFNDSIHEKSRSNITKTNPIIAFNNILQIMASQNGIIGIDRKTMPLVKISCDVTERLTSYLKVLKSSLVIVESGYSSKMDSDAISETNHKRIKQMTGLYDKLSSSWVTKRNEALTQLIKPYHKFIIIENDELKYHNESDDLSHTSRDEMLKDIETYASILKSNEDLLDKDSETDELKLPYGSDYDPNIVD